MFDVLKGFTHVAWDFDGTLVEHPHSAAMWEFIRENPFGQTHSIVTMRSHGMERWIFPLLEDEGSGLTEEHFEHVLNVPNELYEGYHKASRHPLHDYTEWKGKMCKKIGAEVLVDDMESGAISTRGCEMHEIVHIHPDDLI